MKDILQGNWKKLKGMVKEKWGELTNDEMDQIQGKTEQLIGKLQEKYGYTKQKAEEEVNTFLEDQKVNL